MAKHPNPLPESIEFLTDTEAIEHRQIPSWARSTLYLIFAFMVCAVLWAGFSQIDRVVTARGVLTTTSDTMILQPFVTSVVRGIHVKEGQIVRKNQLLASFDPTFAEADLGKLKHEATELRATVARIEAELEGNTSIAGDFEPDTLKTHNNILRERLGHHEAKLVQFERSVRQYSSDRKASRENQTIMRKRLASAREIESMERKLSKEGTGSRLKLLAAQDQRLSYENEFKTAVNTEQSLNHRIEALKAEITAYKQNRRRLITEELLAAQASLLSVQRQIDKAKRLANLAELLAPADGVVLEIAERSIGSVAREAEPLITLVPLDAPLEAEIEILAKDIGYLRTDDEARVKIDAFPYQKHGTLKGTLRVTSEGVFTQRDVAGGVKYYQGRVSIEGSRLQNVPAGARLIPGMSLSTEIVVGQRSILSYFIYPIIRTLDESIREP